MKHVVALLLFLVAGQSLAHGFSRSVSSWRFQGEELQVRFSAPLIVSESVPFNNPKLTPAERFQHHLQQTLKVTQGGAECNLTKIKTSTLGNKVIARARLRCPDAEAAKAGNLTITVDSFFDSDPSHVHFARFFIDNRFSEYIFSSQVREHFIAATDGEKDESGTSVLLSYLGLGVKHILEGIDHLAFVLALLLVCGRTRAIIWAITGFTLGHSLTLGLAAGGWLVANIPAVEALIGWTILLMALEYSGLRQNNLFMLMSVNAALLAVCLALSFFVPSRLTALALLGLIVFSLSWGKVIKNETQARQLIPILSIGFGLIHGLGFAAVLDDIGLPQNYFLTALLGFNLGVEIGQLLFVAFVGVSTWLFAQTKISFRGYGEPLLASFLVGLGVYWFLGRNFF